MPDVLSERRQRVVLSRQASTWANATAGVHQGSILGPLLILIYINDKSLFSVTHDSQISANVLSKDLKMIRNWAFQWKISFNPDSTKQAQKVIFSCKTKKLPHPSLVFNNANVTQSIYQKHLAIILDSKLTFENHINVVTTKTKKTMGTPT